MLFQPEFKPTPKPLKRGFKYAWANFVASAGPDLIKADTSLCEKADNEHRRKKEIMLIRLNKDFFIVPCILLYFLKDSLFNSFKGLILRHDRGK